MKCSVCRIDYPSLIRCRKHRQNICGSVECTMAHARNRGACEFREATDWLDIAVMAAAVFLVACVVAVVAVH